ncbi:MAG: endonuclease/exonuclease/phosphatase family protein [Filomicrobium sp.]
MTVLVHALRTATLLLAVVTLTGMLAPLIPVADIVNHFRPWILLCCFLLLAAAPAQAKLNAAGAALVTLNAVLLIVPISINSLTPTPSRTAGQTGEVSVLSLNVLSSNQTPEKVSDVVLAEDADVVLLQEMSSGMKDTPLPRLRSIYPHIYDCDCQAMVLLSKQAWVETGSQPRTRTQPPLIWARFKTSSGRAYRVMGTHTTYPLNRGGHARHFEWLATQFPKIDEPLVFAGDFNASPWSWNLTRFSWGSGLSRTFTFSLSWPSYWPFQLLMIDNIFYSKDVRVTSTRIGPHVGSDHRPIIARIAVDG